MEADQPPDARERDAISRLLCDFVSGADVKIFIGSGRESVCEGCGRVIHAGQRQYYFAGASLLVRVGPACCQVPLELRVDSALPSSEI